MGTRNDEWGINRKTLYDLQKRHGRELGAFAALPVPVTDIRCDLHPRWLPDGRITCGCLQAAEAIDVRTAVRLSAALVCMATTYAAGATASVDGSSDWSCTATFRMAPTVTTVS